MLKYVNLPSVLLISLIIRVLITGASLGEALSLMALAALYAFYIHFEYKRAIPPNKELIDKVAELESKLVNFKDKELLDRVIEVEAQLSATRDKVNSINLGAQFKR